MALGSLGIAKTIAANAPKYSRIVEPFADMGTVAMFPGMKKPKQHIVNIENETTFALMLFLQGLSAADKKKLKAYDWVSSPEAFDAALAITAIEGAELFYRYFYLKQFGVRAKELDQPPTYDWLTMGADMKSLLFTLPLDKVSLKKVTLTNEDPLAIMGQGGGADTFMILLPMTPEQSDAVESRLGSVGANYFFAKKSKSNDELFESAASAGDVVVSTFAASSIMMATMEVRTNYMHKSANKLKIVEPVETGGA